MEDQIILIDKPAGISSFGVVAKIRGKLKAEFGHKVKVGHTGTLDPFATGLLILLSGKMTKKSNEFLKLDKVYEATLKLGYTSTTGDPYQNQALISCTCGGISMAGGEGGIYNLLVGIFIMGTLTNGMTIMGISIYWQYVVQGIVLAISVGMDWYRRTHVKSKLVSSK